MTATSPPTATEGRPGEAPLTGARAGADGVLRVLGIITMVAIAIQFGLAGFGAFGGGFAAHAILGTAIGLLTLLIAIAAIVARPNRSAVIASIVLLVLAVAGQPLFAGLGESAGAWAGGLHALSGVAIFGLTGWLMGGAARRGADRSRARTS